MIDNSDIEDSNALILNMEYLTKLSVYLCKVNTYKNMKTSSEMVGPTEQVNSMEFTEESANE